MNRVSDEDLMRLALGEAEQAMQTGDVPVGAIVVDEAGNVIGTGRNRREIDNDPTGHAEIVAMRAAAARLGTWRLYGATLVVTLEPCVMCASAIVHARVSRLVFGAWDPKAGAAGSTTNVFTLPSMNHRVDVFGGVLMEESARLLNGFFQARRSDPT